MFVSIPTHARPTLRWATPALFALLWLAYLWASVYPDSVRHDLLLEWGTLSGGLAPGSVLHWSQPENWLRLLSALFLHADWAHLLGNLVFLLIFAVAFVMVKFLGANVVEDRTGKKEKIR